MKSGETRAARKTKTNAIGTFEVHADMRILNTPKRPFERRFVAAQAVLRTFEHDFDEISSFFFVVGASCFGYCC